ncbi:MULTISPECIES: RNA polymerase sigma factor [Paenibacillus]|uniref:RNA polymerase sigma factor n=1 Tax=Paenibacillus TaxID=44249 RepID=UPI000381EBA0|nr:sigma-70 family RNA polymerase sigma factor [Paenibacillus massiliensis]
MQATIPGDMQVKRDKYQRIEQAVERVKAGEQEAYEIIILEFERQMYTYCYYILRNHEETEDAVQDIFIRAYENLERYQRQATFSAWLYKIAYNHLMNIKKKQSRWLKLVNEFKKTEPVVQVSPYATVIEELLTYLTPEERHILLLKAVEQYSFDEIGAIMNIKPATLRKKYERLRRKLMEHTSKGGFLHGQTARSHL